MVERRALHGAALRDPDPGPEINRFISGAVIGIFRGGMGSSMKLWLLTQSENTGYDTYSAAVVCAKDKAEARRIHPAGDDGWSDNASSVWCKTPKAVNVELLGTAKPGSKKGVVVASFHAG